LKKNLLSLKRFSQLVENVQVKRNSERFPDCVFFFNGEKLLAEYDKRFPKNIWIAWDIWSVFANEYAMQLAEVKEFIRKQVEKHFKMKVSEPLSSDGTRLLWVEKHFKMKVSEK
jgi:hypothetical protein